MNKLCGCTHAHYANSPSCERTLCDDGDNQNLPCFSHQPSHSIERSNVFFRALISAITVTIRYTFILNKPVILAKVLWESHRTCDFFDERGEKRAYYATYYRGVASFPSAAPRKHADSSAAPSMPTKLSAAKTNLAKRSAARSKHAKLF